MKKILFIGAGFLQTFLIKKARDMGYYTIAIDKNPSSIGFSFVNEFGIVDIVDQKACLEFAHKKKIDGVITAATDYGVLSTAFIAKNMGLLGLDYMVAQVIKDKYLVRKTLVQKVSDGISQFFEIANFDDINKLINNIKYPIMVKPCDGSGSKAARRVDYPIDFEKACKEAMSASLAGRAFIEDFIIGKEYGVESFVYNGKVFVLAVMSKIMTEPPYYAELGHCMPSRLKFVDKVKDVVEQSIKALGINFGAVNMDVLVTDDGKVCIVDIGARMGGNLIGSHIIPIGTGIDYMGNLICSAVGDPIDINPNCIGKNIATRLLALTPGEITYLPNFDEISQKYNVDIYHHLKVGDTIREYRNNLDGCGYVVAVGDDVNEVEKRVENVKNYINNNILRR